MAADSKRRAPCRQCHAQSAAAAYTARRGRSALGEHGVPSASISCPVPRRMTPATDSRPSPLPLPDPAGGQVCAVAVTYRPDLALLAAALRACRPQVAELLVVDNGSLPAQREALRAVVREAGAVLLALDANLGIAAAQNRGIAWARARGASHVLLLDQDSVPAPDMVARLQQALLARGDGDAPVAAVGPRLVDRRSGVDTPFVRIGVAGVRRLACGDGPGRIHETDFLVASGALIPLVVFDAVGTMEEGLFIDNVDLEWCFRARAKGYVLLGVCDAVLQHSVGEQVVHVAGRALYRHGPLRQYYIMRNRIALYRRRYSPWAWVVQDFLRMLVKVVVFGLVFAPRRENLRMMARGVVDGLRGRSGPFPG